MIVFLFSVILAACSEAYQKPSINQNISSPLGIQSADHGFFVLNGNAASSYNEGSILLLDHQGDKLKAYPTHSMGRTLLVRGKQLAVGYESHLPNSKDGLIEIYNITGDASSPGLSFVSQHILPQCTPVQIAAHPSSPYLAVSCMGGLLYAGRWSDPALKPVRHYAPGGAYTYRALYLDSGRNLLFLFPSDYGEPSLRDQIMTDTHSMDLETGVKTQNTPDDSPDRYTESDVLVRKLKNKGSAYNFFVLNLKDSETEGFLSKNWKDHGADLKSELHWMHAPLGETLKEHEHYYRTNFWHAVKDPIENDVFYLSHRGSSQNKEPSNRILKLRIKGPPTPLLNDFLSVESAWESKEKNMYLSSFDINREGTQPFFVMNSFQNLVHFESQQYRLLAATTNPSTSWSKEISSSSLANSYFDFALGQDGKVLITSYFDNSLVLAQIKIGEEITVLKKIR
jgi:hypothetical protein